MSEKGLLIVVSAPSGTGKGSIISKLLEEDNNITHSVSATTRKPRKGETEGVSYFFMDNLEFEEMIEDNAFIEWDKYIDNYYGTPKKYIIDKNNEGTDVILDITVRGAVDLKEQWNDVVMIFVLPPSIEELERRIKSRAANTEEEIKMRLETAYKEFKYIEHYEYVIVNDDLSLAVSQIKTIIDAERMKYKRNPSIVEKIYKGEIK